MRRWYYSLIVRHRFESDHLHKHRVVVAAVARQAHNLKVGGSIPSHATNVRVEANSNKTDYVEPDRKERDKAGYSNNFFDVNLYRK